MPTSAIHNSSDELSPAAQHNELDTRADRSVKISVIIPVYNAENFIGETLQSIREQTLRDIEIICINDASSDASLAVLREHMKQDKRITVVDIPRNVGTGRAINLGIQAASGIYIQIVGNDDKLTPDALEKLYKLCESERLDFCLYAAHVFADNPNDAALATRAESQVRYLQVANEYPIASGIELMQLLVANNEYRMHNGAQIVRKQLLNQHEISNIEGIHHEDMYYTYRILLAADRATILSDPLYLYRIRRGSLESMKRSRLYSPEEFSSILTSVAAMIDVTPEKLLASQDFAPVAEWVIYRYLDSLTNRYVKLPPEKRQKVKPESKTARSLLYTIKLYASKREQSIQATNEKLAKLKSSRSYKLGHAMLAGPRFIKKIFKRRQKNR